MNGGVNECMAREQMEEVSVCKSHSGTVLVQVLLPLLLQPPLSAISSNDDDDDDVDDDDYDQDVEKKNVQSGATEIYFVTD